MSFGEIRKYITIEIVTITLILISRTLTRWVMNSWTFSYERVCLEVWLPEEVAESVLEPVIGIRK